MSLEDHLKEKIDHEDSLSKVMNQIGFTKIQSPETIKMDLEKVNEAKEKNDKEENPDEEK